MEVILSYLLFIRNTTYSRCLKIFFYWILPSLEWVVNFTEPSTIHFDYHGHHHHHVNQPARFYTRHKCFFYSHRLINSHTRQLFYYLQIIQLGKVSQKNHVKSVAFCQTGGGEGSPQTKLYFWKRGFSGTTWDHSWTPKTCLTVGPIPQCHCKSF